MHVVNGEEVLLNQKVQKIAIAIAPPTIAVPSGRLSGRVLIDVFDMTVLLERLMDILYLHGLSWRDCDCVATRSVH